MFLTKKINLIGCLLLVLLGFSSQLKAISGAEMTYLYLDSNKYIITLQVYRDCSDPVLPNSQTINFNSVLCGAGSSAVLSLDSTLEISGLRPDTMAYSTCNGGTLPGMELYVYTDTIIFLQTCQDWIISWTGCCRSSSITNLTTTGSPIYIEVGIDSRYKYSGPRFINTSAPQSSSYWDFMMVYYPADSTFMRLVDRPLNYYNPDTLYQLDSRLVALTCPLQGPSNCLSHIAGLSADQPIVGDLSINVINGWTSIRPQVGLSQNAATAVTIHFMNNNDTVGFIQRDFPIIVIDSPVYSIVPIELMELEVLTGGGYDSITNMFHLCPSSAITLSMTFYNHDETGITLDPIYTNLDSIFGPGHWTSFLNTNSPFRPDSVQVFFLIFSPPFSDTCCGSFSLGIKSYLVLFPFSESSIFTFYFGRTQLIVQASSDTICPYIGKQIQLNAWVQEDSLIAGQGSYSWTQVSGPPVLFSNDTIPNPTVIVPAYPAGDSVVLSISHTSAIHPNSNFSCPLQNQTIVLYYDTAGSCSIPYPKAVEGVVWDDSNSNCIPDSTEQRHRLHSLIAFDNGLDTFYYATDTNSYYESFLDTGTYVVHYINNNPIWQGCPSGQVLVVDTTYASQLIDFVVEPLFFCPLLAVEIETYYYHNWFCHDQDIAIAYSNEGTIAANSPYVSIELDPSLTFVSSTIPFSSQVGNLYTFNLDTIDYGDSGEFEISVDPDCNIPWGVYYRVTAHIYPDSLCNPLARYIVIGDSCIDMPGILNDSVMFFLNNQSVSFSSPMNYWLLENQVVVDTGTIQLTPGQSLTVIYPRLPDKSYQLVLDPFSTDYIASYPIMCSGPYYYGLPAFSPNFRLPYVSTYHNLWGRPHDPNIKVAVPEGVDSAHYILPNHSINYTIHFQNTGTDTAITVVLLDTLSNVLNIGSLEMGMGSAPYTWQIKPYNTTGLHVLEITFDNIMLPDSNINEEASHGFVKYQIEQQVDLPNFTRIENSASIYFDTEAPIKTNTTFHTVCDNCILMNITGNSVITSVESLEEGKSSTKLYPNPTTGWLMIEQAFAQQADVQVYNISGILLQEKRVQNTIDELNISEFPSGTYFVRIVTKGDSELFKVIKQ
jgi:uncharacterized repeat protein (TIGR01451 family)